MDNTKVTHHCEYTGWQRTVPLQMGKVNIMFSIFCHNLTKTSFLNSCYLFSGKPGLSWAEGKEVEYDFLRLLDSSPWNLLADLVTVATGARVKLLSSLGSAPFFSGITQGHLLNQSLSLREDVENTAACPLRGTCAGY